jgi:ribosomal protein S8
MSMSDPIADMLTRIRNAQGVQKNDRGHAIVESQSSDCQRPEGRGLH